MFYEETVETVCKACGRVFLQAEDPGRRREYCRRACQQRAYRQRHPGRGSGTHAETPGARQRRQEREDAAREEARKAWDREYQRARRHPRGEEQVPTPEWTQPRAGDSPTQAKWRRVCGGLYKVVNHPRTDPLEAKAFQRKAEELRRRYGL